MRLLLVGAFPYPHHHGSQVYFQEQAIALRAAGHEVELLTYASGIDGREDPDRWRAVDGFRHWRAPKWSETRSLKSGPNWGKPLSDLGLRSALNDAIASNRRDDLPFDLIMTHNIESCVIALSTCVNRGQNPTPIVYCVHTLMANELSAYPKLLKELSFEENDARASRIRRSGRRVIDSFGKRLDRGLAKRCDGWIALTQTAARVMRRHSHRPGALIAPPLPDPRHRPASLEIDTVKRQFALTDDPYLIYSGNLDGYQEIEILTAAARLLERDFGTAGPTIVLASHDARSITEAALPDCIRRCVVASDYEMQALIAGARASLIMRRAAGGFPIKLANSLAAGTAPIVFLGSEWGLRDGVNARVVELDNPVESLAVAMAQLGGDGDLAERLGAGARAHYLREHLPSVVADRTEALLRSVLQSGPE